MRPGASGGEAGLDKTRTRATAAGSLARAGGIRRASPRRACARPDALSARSEAPDPVGPRQGPPLACAAPCCCYLLLRR